jgi:hypothetical protein
MEHMADIEGVYTYEGTNDVNTLSVGQAIIGHRAFSHRPRGAWNVTAAAVEPRRGLGEVRRMPRPCFAAVSAALSTGRYVP